MRRREIAIGIFVAPVEDAPASLPRNPLCKLAGFALWTLDAQGLRADELAFRISGTAGEFAVLAVLLHQLRTAFGAFFVQEFVGLKGFARACFQAARRLAIRISRAGQEHSPAAALDDHFAPAIVAGLNFRRAVLALGRQFVGSPGTELEFAL